MRALFCLLLAISLAVGCGGDHEGGPGEGSGQDADSEADAAEGGVADTVVRTDAGSSCTVHVAVSGSDVGECGAPATPCATITAGLERADEGCTVSVGAGTWSSATGESLPIVITDRVHLMGAGADATIIDDTVGSAETLYPTCENDRAPVVVLAGDGAQLSGLSVHGTEVGTTPVTVLVVEGSAEVFQVVVTGGQDGIFIAGQSTATIRDLEVYGAGHAAIKPAGTSTVIVTNATLHHSKDALEPVCQATVTISDSDVHCNGNGIEALAQATTVALGNHIYNNNIGLAARGGGTLLTARDNVLEANKLAVVEIGGALDLGTTADPGGNTLSNNRHAGVLLSKVVTDVYAVGNTWEPGVDGADAAGAYTEPTAFSASSAMCPNTIVNEIDTAFDAACETGFTKESGYQNVAINDGSCAGGAASTVGVLITAE